MQFSDSVIARNVTIGPTKMSYMFSYGSGPYFTEMNFRDIVQGPSYFTLHFYETVCGQTKKWNGPTCTLLVWDQQWSENEVCDISYFGHANAVNVVKEMLTALEELGITLKLINGPNVNKSILYKLNKVRKEKGFPELVSFPTSCLIHVCHNSFRKGVLQYGSGAEELCLNMFYIFSKT